MRKKFLTKLSQNTTSSYKLSHSHKKWDSFRKTSFLKDQKRRNYLKDIILNQNPLKTIRSLLPLHTSSPYLSLSYEYFPVGRYGGDFFDFFWTDENNVSLYLFDISGHTEELGEIVLFLRFWIDKLPNESLKHPSLILNFLNEKITMQYDDFLYVNMWCCNINLITLKLTFSSAGSPSPIWISKSKKANNPSFRIENSLPLGANDKFLYKECSTMIASEGTLYCMSDGVYEVKLKETSNFLGHDGLKNLIIKNCSKNLKKSFLTPKEIKKIIINLSLKKKLDDDFSLIKLDLKLLS